MSIKGWDQEDLLAWGMLGGVMARYIDTIDGVTVSWYKDDEGYYEEFLDVEMHGRRFRLRCEPAATVRDDLVALRDELGNNH